MGDDSVVEEFPDQEQRAGVCYTQWRRSKENMQVHNIEHCLSAENLRIEVFESRPHLVAPVVLLTEGVHHGSGGRLYYPLEELQKYPEAWNGIPLPVFHPDENGNPISANDPAVIDRQTVGRLFNVHLDGNALKGELWVDEEKCRRISSETLDILKTGRQLEVSTGVFTEDEMVGGVWNGEEYEAVARNYRPDHLALLPGGRGACSWEDGCGAPRLNKEDNMDEKIEEASKFKRLIIKCGEFLGLKGLEASHEDIRMALQHAVDALDTSSKVHFVREVYDDYFIYAAQGTDPSLDGSQKLYKRGYTKQDDETVELADEVQEVKEETRYVEVNADGSTVDKNQNAPEKGDHNKEGIMENTQLKERVDALISCQDNKFCEEDRPMLEKLDEKELEKLEAVVRVETNQKPEEKPEEKEPEIKEEKETTMNEKPKTPEEAINAMEAPEEVKEILQSGLKMQRDKKAKLIKGLLENKRNKFTEDQLKTKSVDELEALAELGQVAVDYSGNAAPTDQQSVGPNERRPDGSGVPEPAKINWAQAG
jgi:hypothetical protein